ncbi:MAG: MAPEG family protein [Cyanobacteria bacterium J06636_16]
MSALQIALYTNSILLAIILLMQPFWRDIKQGMAYTLSNFDERRDEGIFARRLDMVRSNQIEALGLLIPICILAFSVDMERPIAAYAAYVHIAARMLYAIVSLAGIPVARSLFWTVSYVAWGVIAWTVLADAF